MKIQTSFEAEIRTLVGTSYKTDDGKQGTSYKIGLELSNGDMGQLPCTKEFVALYDRKDVVKGDLCRVYAEYDSNYKSLKVFNAVLL